MAAKPISANDIAAAIAAIAGKNLSVIAANRAMSFTKNQKPITDNDDDDDKIRKMQKK